MIEMKEKKIIRIIITLGVILITIISPYYIQAQEKVSLSGHIKDATTGEDLIGATVYVKELKTGAVSNTYGFYSLTVKAGKYSIVYRFVGYKSIEKELDLSADRTLSIELEMEKTQLDEVVIKGEHIKRNVQSAEMGIVKMNMKEIESIPVLFGERDILKTIQLMPGVSAGSEGSSGFFVRGGKMDQNLILLDEAPVYNAAHLLGFFSVFNSDALKDVKLYKAGIPARYGGRLSSVMDIHTNNGNLKKFKVKGGIGLISSRITLEGPFQKDKGSILLSGRRTYGDIFFGMINKDFNGNSLYFYDLNAKVNYIINENNRIFISAYNGRDKFKFSEMGFSWGNQTVSARWNHVFNSKLFSNTSVIFSDYNYEIDGKFGKITFNMGSGIQDYHFKQDFTYYLNTNNTVRAGFSSDYHVFFPGEKVITSDQITSSELLPKSYAIENGLYISNEQEIGALWKFTYGLRLSTFSQVGKAEVYSYDVAGDVVDTTSYGKLEHIKTYWNLEPRLSARYMLSETSSIKASFHRMSQYIHLLSSSTSGNPTDVWISSSANVQPGLSDQYAIGYFRNFLQDKLETSVEVYYKSMDHQIDYKNGADVLFNPNVESVLAYGKARSFGVEFFVKKRFGKWTGWVSYTLSKTEKYFDIIQKEWFPARQDRRHDISIVSSYQFAKRWTASATWVFYNGDAVTMPVGAYYVAGQLVPYYTERNGSSMPDYHRLDVGVTWHGKPNKRFQSDWNFSVYNAYARKNAYAITFEEDPDNLGSLRAMKTSLFSIIPSISWNFKF